MAFLILGNAWPLPSALLAWIRPQRTIRDIEAPPKLANIADLDAVFGANWSKRPAVGKPSRQSEARLVCGAFGQAVCFLLLGDCLRRMTGERKDFGHAPVGFGLPRPQLCRLLQITKRIRILPGALAFLRQPQGGHVEQIHRSRI